MQLIFLIDPHRNGEIRDTRRFARSFKIHAFKYNVIDRFLFIFEYNKFKKKRSTNRLDEGFYTDTFLQRIIQMCVHTSDALLS